MNTRFLFTLLVVVLVATACAPAITDIAAPVELAAPPADNQGSPLVPVTGESAVPAARESQESRQWSGEIFLSEDNSPDLKLNNNIHIDQKTTTECVSEDSLPRRQSGCIQ